jgi:hypothetical protein
MGATIDLPKQPAIKQTGFGPAFAGATIVLVIGLLAMSAWLVGSNVTSLSSAADRSYTDIETLRNGTTLSASDTSLTKVESIRGGAMGGAVDMSLTKIESLRGEARGGPVASGATTVKPFRGDQDFLAPVTVPSIKSLDYTKGGASLFAPMVKPFGPMVIGRTDNTDFIKGGASLFAPVVRHTDNLDYTKGGASLFVRPVDRSTDQVELLRGTTLP